MHPPISWPAPRHPHAQTFVRYRDGVCGFCIAARTERHVCRLYHLWVAPQCALPEVGAQLVSYVCRHYRPFCQALYVDARALEPAQRQLFVQLGFSPSQRQGYALLFGCATDPAPFLSLPL